MNSTFSHNEGPISPYQAMDSDSHNATLSMTNNDDENKLPLLMEQSSLDHYRQKLEQKHFRNSANDEHLDKKKIRNEWINSLFGTDFFEQNEDGSSKSYPIDYIPLLKGVGTANIPTYIAYSASIDPSSAKEKDKIGVTISRLPLGVYAHAVDNTSEAYACGVIPGSILVDINGMGVLGEPSHKLIERLWQYEGFGVNEDVKGVIDGLISLKFLKDGKIYECLFLQKPPFGISWAPCGNFALVQRSYSFAQKAGIKRGCIIASINGKSFRDLDHAAAAETLRDLFCKREKITMTLAYTPAASRSSYFASLKSSSQTPNKKSAQTLNSATLNFLQNSISCGSSSSLRSTPVVPRPQPSQMAKLAEKVAAGAIQPASSKTLRRESKSMKVPSNHNTEQKELKYLPCPELERNDILNKWNILNALFYCLKMSMAEYSEEHFKLIPQGEDINNDVDLCMETLENFGKAEISMFLLQIVGIMGSEEIYGEMGEKFACTIIDTIKESEDLCFRFHYLILAFLGNSSTKSSIGNSTLSFARDKLSTCLAEIESTRSAIQLQSRSHSIENINLQGTLSLDQSKATSGSKSFERVQDIVEEIFDGIENNEAQLDSMQQDHAPTLSNFNEESDQEEKSKKKKKKKKKGFMKKMFGKKSKNVEPPLPPVVSTNATASKSFDNSEYSPNHLQEIVQNSSTVPLGLPQMSQDSQFPFLSSSASIQSRNGQTPTPILRTKFNNRMTPFELNHTMSTVYTNEAKRLAYMSTRIKEMDNFLNRLNEICGNIQSLLIKSNSQKVVEWAINPWNATKEKTLLEATEKLRSELADINMSLNFPLINPTGATELLSSVDPGESFILPSAHFPLLLSFNQHKLPDDDVEEEDVLYRTKVEVISLRGGRMEKELEGDTIFFVQGSVSGQVQETGKSTLGPYFESTLHRWYNDNVMVFDTRSSWGFPRTMSIKMKAINPKNMGADQSIDDDGAKEIGYCWIDLSDMWSTSSKKLVKHAQLYASDEVEVSFDAQGDLIQDIDSAQQRYELELKISVDAITITPALTRQHPKLCSKKLLLYKHTEDIRQEMLAVQFIRLSNELLISCGLDLKIRTFKCCAVSDKCGFVEWVPGSVPLSEICERGGTAGSGHTGEGKMNTISFLDGMEMEDENGKFKSDSSSSPDTPTQNNISETFLNKSTQSEFSRFRALRGLSNFTFGFGVGLGKQGNDDIRNPVQDFLRSAAFDIDAPYFINRTVMDTYVKSCAGYCVLTYLLGVGDRHLDNLLLHPQGYFLHCDFSFILGQDPKTYIPVRITEEMVMGMGGRESDNFAKFLSLTGAAFVALRRHSNLRALMSLFRIMVDANLPDVSLNQTAEDALFALRYRFRLDLNEGDALAFIEKLIETSISSKLWVAVDAIHSFGKKF